MNESEANPNMDNKCPQCGAPLPSGVLAGLCPACLFKQGAAADTAVPPETTAFQPPSVEEVARLFPQLEILAFIGKGGMGAVYKARQPGLDRIVALKIIPPQTATGPGFIERFNREARALAKLNHPNIVAVYEFGQANGLPFFIMEFVDGLNLRQLERAGKLSAREALQIVPQICEALQFAHDEGIVHRDIKPENILLDKKGRVKIADFGIAKILSGGPDVAITETGGSIGTPHYMAPEQMEKPTTVDHRADIFSLGVVFYEMLTGELPLGKFAPPSSRKVEVDVRLDDVVLRALEKDPERRYQHASQVKTAVDTIASSAAPPPMSDARAMAGEILAQDSLLDIGHCIRRGWKLLRANFGPFVGVTALLMALLAFAASVGSEALRQGPAGQASGTITSMVFLIAWGPLAGGWCLYFLKKIRGEKSTVETIFSGFTKCFLHLFLAGFVTFLLTWLGFVCLILPGVYLLIAWMFTFPLVMDKQLDFWSAMELSRKVVTKHWWKFFAFGIFSLLYLFVGSLAFGVGVFIAMPLVLASLMYAYEDIFGGLKQTATPPVMGPFGTAVLPGASPKLPRSGWPVALAGLGVVGIGIVLCLLTAAGIILLRHTIRQRHEVWIPQPPTLEQPALALAAEPIESPDNSSAFVFGPVVERDLQTRVTGTNEFLDLDTQQLLTPPSDIMNVLATNQFGDDRLWEALDIPADSRLFKYPKWLEENGVDVMYAGDGKVIGFDGVFSVAHGDSSTNWDDWDGMTPEQVRQAVNWESAATAEWTQRRDAAEARLKGQPAPSTSTSAGGFRSAAQLDSREPGGPLVNLLTRDQSVTWFFKTREGAMGILQLVGFSDDPPAAKIRYKLIQQTNDQGAVITVQAGNNSQEALAQRLEAASIMNDMTAKNKALSVIATDAARAGNAKVVSSTLNQIYDFTTKSQTALEAVRLLAKRGMRKQALGIAKSIDDYTMRDQALSELAQ